MKRGEHVILSVILVYLLTIISGYSPAQDIYVQPSETVTSMGEFFNVDIMVRDVIGLSTFELRVLFDKDILEGVTLAKGSLWNDPDYLWHAGVIDNTSGTIGFTSGAASSGSEPFGINVDSNGGMLATITFQAIARGTSTIGLTDVLTYDVDGNEISVNAIDGIVNSVNRQPVADDQSVITNEDTPVDITLTGSDPDGDTLTYTVVSNPSNGSLSGTAPNLTYTPNAGYSGNDSFTFKVNDGTVDSNIATVSITVNPVNDPPVADDQSVTTSEDTPVGITLTGSDTDGDTLTYTVVSNPSNGSLSGTAPSLTYIPNPNHNSSDSFTFKVNDGTVDSNIATVSITVNPVNDPPVADDQSVTTSEGTSVPILLTGSDPDGDSLTYTVVSNPSNGSLSGTAPNLTYTPNTGFSGNDSFTFKANDGAVDSNIATVSITVEPLEDVSTMVQVNTTDPDYDESGSQLLMLATWENIGTRRLSKPLRMVVEKIKPSSIKVVNADGATPDGKAYYDYSSSVGDGKLDPGETSEARQIILSGPGGILRRMKFTLDLSCWAHIDIGGSIVDSKIASATIAVNPIEAPGWSLISLPVQPSDMEPSSVLSSMYGKFNSVWAYDPDMGWSTYAPGAPSNLQKMEPGVGYWIKTNQPGALIVEGAGPKQTAVFLKGGGWNLVGYSSQDHRSAEECMSQVADAIESVWQYDPEAGWSTYTPGGVNDLGAMEPGYGYWIEANRDCIWNVNAIAPAAAPPLTVKFKSSHVPASTPGMPYRIWGNVEINGMKMMEADNPIVILEVNGKVYSSYKLGTVKSYGDSYVLDIPASVTNSAQAEILVQVGGKIIEAGPVPPGRPGQLLRFDLSIKFSPKTSMLYQNYPNPFNPETWIPYELSEASNVQVEIYSLSSQLVRKLDLGYKQPGFYKRKEDAAYWDGRNEKGEKVASGIYFYTIKADGFSTTRKMTLLR